MDKVSQHISAIVQAVRSYTNRPFIGNVLYYGDIKIEGGDISPFLINLEEGDIVEIIGSVYSDGVYLVKNSEELFERIRDEEFKGYFVLLKLPLHLESLKALANYSSSISEKAGIRREGVGDVSYTLHSGSDLIQGYPRTIMSSLSAYRRLPNNYNKEMYHALNSAR